MEPQQINGSQSHSKAVSLGNHRNAPKTQNLLAPRDIYNTQDIIQKD